MSSISFQMIQNGFRYLDRLLHRGHVAPLADNSYRLKQ